MAEQTNQEELAIRYLLGGLSEIEQTTLEEKILSDNAMFENMEIAEGEVIDRYVRDELNEQERQRVRNMIFHSPRLAERAEIARIMARKVPSPAPEQNDPQPTEKVKPKKDKPKRTPWWNLFGPPQMAPAMQLVMAAPLILLLFTGIALVVVWTNYRSASQQWTITQERLSKLQNDLDAQDAKRSELEDKLRQTEQERTDQARLVASLQQQLEERGATASTIFSFILNPGTGTRGGGSAEPKFSIPHGKDQLELQLNVESGDYRQYIAFLQDIEFKPIGQHQRLTPIRQGRRKFIPFKVPVSLIRPGSYMVHVDGVASSGVTENFNEYPFRVTDR